jgi:sulfur relay protein TusB/DsrH
MLVIIKSAPRTDEARRGLRVAMDTSSDVVLVQDGVYLAAQGALEGFTGKAYLLEDDVTLRGKGAATEGFKRIGYGEFVDLMDGGQKVLGMF